MITKFRNSKLIHEFRHAYSAIVKYENLVRTDSDKDDTALFHTICYNTIQRTGLSLNKLHHYQRHKEQNFLLVTKSHAHQAKNNIFLSC